MGDVHRYIPASDADRESMLREIGAKSIDELFATIPPALRLKEPLPLAAALSEQEKAFGNFAPMRYGWVCDRFHVLREPVPLRGQQSIWQWEAPSEVLRTDERPIRTIDNGGKFSRATRRSTTVNRSDLSASQHF